MKSYESCWRIFGVPKVITKKGEVITHHIFIWTSKAGRVLNALLKSFWKTRRESEPEKTNIILILGIEFYFAALILFELTEWLVNSILLDGGFNGINFGVYLTNTALQTLQQWSNWCANGRIFRESPLVFYLVSLHGMILEDPIGGMVLLIPMTLGRLKFRWMQTIKKYLTYFE